LKHYKPDQCLFDPIFWFSGNSAAVLRLTHWVDLGNPNIMLAIKLLSFSAVKPLNLFSFSLEPH